MIFLPSSGKPSDLFIPLPTQASLADLFTAFRKGNPMADRVKSRLAKKPRASASRLKAIEPRRANRHSSAVAKLNGANNHHPLDYPAVVDRVQSLINKHVPAGATIAVVSKGDPHLVQFSDRIGWHFPRNEQGDWAGFHPADSNSAIAQLEEARAGGATYFLIPHTFIWWLDHYGGFKRYLEESYRLADSGEYGVLYELSSTEKNKLNQVSTRVDYLLGVLYPLLDKLRQSADAHPPVEDRTGELTEAIQNRLTEMVQSLQQTAQTIPDPSERLESLAEHLAGLAATIEELHKKLDAIASMDGTAAFEQKLQEQEEYLTAQFERRLLDQRREFDRHLQDQHVVMLRLLDEQQRIFQQNQREMDEKLSAQIDAVMVLLNGEMKRASELKTQIDSLTEQVQKQQESKPGIIPATDGDDMTSHQRRFNLSMMQAMDSIAAHLRAVDAQMNLLNHRTSAEKPPIS